jgi:ubiquinone/menaquinone biosynthesis C-methylase UbiE
VASIEYHLGELEIALTPGDERRILPDVLDTDRFVLDIGCGIGQTLLALGCKGRICVGIDIDEASIRYGIENHGDLISYIVTDAKKIPLPSGVFDLAFCRVSLPYTNIPVVVREISRVLRPKGRIWLTLHDKARVQEYAAVAFRSKNLKRMLHAVYVLANGYAFKFFGLVFPYLNGRYESWQDEWAMKNLLRKSGFEMTVQKIGRHTVFEGVRT